MKPRAELFVSKAEAHYRTARRELRARLLPNYDASCYHAHQCVEKYLKATLEDHEIEPPKTHNLERILKEILPLEPAWAVLSAALIRLTSFGSDFRYDDMATREDAREAIALAREIREFIRERLDSSHD